MLLKAIAVSSCLPAFVAAGCSSSAHVDMGNADAGSNGDGTATGDRPPPGSEAGFDGANDSPSDDGFEASSDSSMSDGATPAPPSCQTNGAGLTDCGASRDSCCSSPAVTGGTYYRTYDTDADGGSRPSADGGAANLADQATVGSFRLDKYLVTVGRFRQFVSAWTGGFAPSAGGGKHVHLNGGKGLSATGGSYEPGWIATDDSQVAPTNDNLACDPNAATWTPTAGAREELPINCVNWYEAYAFCIWDSGFLPSEAEWEYAAAGGSLQREYPWGATDPGTQNQYAIYACDYPRGAGTCTGAANFAPVGTPALGVGAWGQLDLAGNVWEWNEDWSAATYIEPCMNCANLKVASYRVFRGGCDGCSASSLMATARGSGVPTGRSGGIGFRCARSPLD